jgi:hypothetical protein
MILLNAGYIPKLLLISLFICVPDLTAKETTDSSKFKLTGEILFSKSRNTVNYSSHFGGTDEFRERSAVLLTLSGEFNRGRNQSAPWFSPEIALGTGYFISNSRYISVSSWFGNRNANGNPVTWYSNDTMGFTAIPLIPQLGFNARPFIKSGRFRNLALTFRAGYQFNIVLDHFAANNKQEDEWIEKYYQEYCPIHTNTTTYKTYKEGHFPKTYLQCGLSNLFSTKHDSRMGYRITYSRNGRVHSGFEISLTCKLP